jgi:hypothetical protein
MAILFFFNDHHEIDWKKPFHLLAQSKQTLLLYLFLGHGDYWLLVLQNLDNPGHSRRLSLVDMDDLVDLVYKAFHIFKP